MITLGIESSCDDTSVALVEDGTRIVSSLVSSQVEIHQRFGGVVPEVASRKHLEAMLPLLQQVMGQAGSGFADIGQIAVTVGPGLLGPLLIGLSTAKALAWRFNLPLIPVNHLEAHLAAAFLAIHKHPRFPYVGLIVSGGHANLVLAEGPHRFTTLGRTADDAPGELFDKAARLLGLGYPGGPAIQKTGLTGDPKRYKLPRPMAGKGLGFSFSGLKTAVLHLFEKEGDRLSLPDVCASLQAAVADTLVGKASAALAGAQAKRFVMAGGVAANKPLREAMAAMCEKSGIEFLVPPPALCTDNAAMVAAQGYFSAATVDIDPLLVNARADWPMGTAFPL
ncbi:MAG TPA: tRNA (adenosine(37)-N6)-threonylcarbamoyltransferase complex transferase subunit TsaD [Candidatus Ozemobacteraceae bacterium]|nr:tRNA (adenosine(37)-N6)-threonylcarbamoyltransferase complex transferase subunit TsaD [Candidatus Ozemobacteraceae bacterium]